MINNTPAQLEHHHQWPHSSRSDPPRSVPGTSADSLSKGDRTVIIGRLKSRSWETPEGERRSMVEVEADEVAPSLRWAIAKPERAANGTAKGGQGNDEAPS
jgi:single-stranded DNA-binding protein